MSLIEVKGLTKHYGDVHAVRGLDLTIEQGEIFSILGPNGAGKTTTVEILEGFRKRDSGSVSVLGFDPGTKGHQSREWRDRIGIVLQTSADAGDLTVFETINHFSGYYSNPREVEEVIDSVGLQEKRDALIRNLSGGQRRRLDVALGIIGNPELLFLDEPTTGLDPVSRGELWDVIRDRVAQGTTVLLTTQYLEEADQLANQIVVIDHGRSIAEGTADELKRRIGGDHLDVHIERQEQFELTETILRNVASGPLRAHSGDGAFSAPVKNGVQALSQVLRELEAQSVAIIDIGLRRPTLDDVFVELTGHVAEESSNV